MFQGGTGGCEHWHHLVAGGADLQREQWGLLVAPMAAHRLRS